MSVYPATTMPKRSPRTWLIVTIATVVAVGAVAAMLAFSFGGSTQTTSSVASSAPSAAQDAVRVPSIATLTPARLAANALGTGYALPTTHSGPSIASVLASMDPQTRRYTQAVMALTFRQLAAGAAGQP